MAYKITNKQLPLTAALGLGAGAALFRTVFLPSWTLHPFAPFLALLYSRTSLSKSLWAAALLGFALDLWSSDMRFGIGMLSAVFTTLLLHRQRSHFFEDKPLSFCLYTTLISSLFTVLMLALCTTLDKKISTSWAMAATDLLLLPSLDGLYAFLWFTCPWRFYQWLVVKLQKPIEEIE